MTRTRLRRGELVLLGCAAVLLGLGILLRLGGPNDLWDHAQPQTMSYTADILVNGRWILPRERDAIPATKPPLYNWLDLAPVLILGSTSNVAHRFPSLVAFVLTWGLIVFIAARTLRGGVVIGTVAAAWFAASAPMFKIGALARPDMLLTFTLLAGASAATVLVAGSGTPRSGLQLVVWGSFALAALTKGPPAVLILIHALMAARVIGGSWRCVGRLGWTWGPIVGVGPPLAWMVGVGLIDADHLRHQLLDRQFVGRMAGTSPEGGGYGPWRLLTSLPLMPVYLLARFVPWSIASAAALVVLWRRRRRLRPAAAPLVASIVLIVAVLAVYSLSAGKRADYLAIAYPPAAILGAWWFLGAGARTREWMMRRAPVALGMAAIVLAVVVLDARRDRLAPVPGFGDAIMAFARGAETEIARDPRPVVFCWAGTNPIQALLGSSSVDAWESVEAALEAGEPFWVLAGLQDASPRDFGVWLEDRRPDLRVRPVLRSATLPRVIGWHDQMTLFAVDPGGDRERPPATTEAGAGRSGPASARPRAKIK